MWLIAEAVCVGFTSECFHCLRYFFPSCVVADCKHHLCEPDLKLVWPSAKLLQAACSASSRASHIVTANVVPSLVEQYNNRSQVSSCSYSLTGRKHQGRLLTLEHSFVCSARIGERYWKWFTSSSSQ